MKYIDKIKDLADSEEFRDGFHLGMKDDSLSIEYEMGLILKKLVSLRNPKVIVEVGTGRGYSTAWIIMGSNGAKVYTIDHEERKPYVWDMIGLKKKPIQLKGECKELADELPEKIDFIFHDASHLAPHVIDDLEALEDKFSKDCFVAIHDIHYVRKMGDEVKDYFQRKSGWTYREMNRSCGLGMARRK